MSQASLIHPASAGAIPAWTFPDTTRFDPSDTTNYYHGIKGNPRLIASSKPGPWKHAQTGDWTDIKRIFHAGKHAALQGALENRNMWDDLLGIIMPCPGSVSVSVFMVGYEILSSPVTILVIVEYQSTTFGSAKMMIEKIKNLLIVYVVSKPFHFPSFPPLFFVLFSPSFPL
jgi:hypothetical protein